MRIYKVYGVVDLHPAGDPDVLKQLMARGSGRPRKQKRNYTYPPGTSCRSRRRVCARSQAAGKSPGRFSPRL
jgi:hypothetical protein